MVHNQEITMRIAINEAKAKLSGLINAALQGEQILLTKHGTPVAEIKALTGVKSTADKTTVLAAIIAKAKTKKTAGTSAAEADHFLYDDSGIPS